MLEHFVERVFEQFQIAFAESRPIAFGVGKVGIDVGVNTVQTVRHGELASHRSITTALAFGFLLGGNRATRDGVFQ